MEYLHTMVRVADLNKSLEFYTEKLGLVETARIESEAGRYTLVYLAAPGDADARQGRRNRRCSNSPIIGIARFIREAATSAISPSPSTIFTRHATG